MNRFQEDGCTTGSAHNEQQTGGDSNQVNPIRFDAGQNWSVPAIAKKSHWVRHSAIYFPPCTLAPGDIEVRAPPKYPLSSAYGST